MSNTSNSLWAFFISAVDALSLAIKSLKVFLAFALAALSWLYAEFNFSFAKASRSAAFDAFSWACCCAKVAFLSASRWAIFALIAFDCLASVASTCCFTFSALVCFLYWTGVLD